MKKQKLFLALAVILPVLFVFVLIALVVIWRGFFSPEYDFVYYKGWKFWYENYFELKNWKIKEKEWDKRPQQNSIERQSFLYMHDVSENKSKKVSPEEINDKYSIKENSVSPDGYVIERYTSNIWVFPFYSSTTRKVQLKSDFVSVNMNTKWQPHEFNFLWWVLEN